MWFFFSFIIRGATRLRRQIVRADARSL